MDYPSLEQVRCATKDQLTEWWRHLPIPGERASGTSNYHEIERHESKVLAAIGEALGIGD